MSGTEPGTKASRARRRLRLPVEGRAALKLQGYRWAMAYLRHRAASDQWRANAPAWMERKNISGQECRRLVTRLRHYVQAANEDRLYRQKCEVARAAIAFDLEATGAWPLAKGAREVLVHGPGLGRPLEYLDTILRPETDPDGALRLVGQMPSWDRECQLSLLAALCAHLFEAKQVIDATRPQRQRARAA